jgi:hypothetical protein
MYDAIDRALVANPGGRRTVTAVSALAQYACHTPGDKGGGWLDKPAQTE